MRFKRLKTLAGQEIQHATRHPPASGCSNQNLEAGNSLLPLMVLITAVTLGVELFGGRMINRLPIERRAAATAHDLERLHAGRAWLLMHAAHYDQRRAVDSRLQDMMGVLPCPDAFTDRVFDGQQAGFCSLMGRTHLTHGWLPERFIAKSFVGTAEDAPSSEAPATNLSALPLLDHAGAPLWYAVAQSHRFGGAGPRNSDLGDAIDDLEIDGRGDFVAILIAGGPSLRHQPDSAPFSSSPNETCADGLNPHPLLEGSLEDENACFGNARYRQYPRGLSSKTHEPGFNDLVLGVSRRAFNDAVESRVLRTLSKIFAEADPSALPDLSPFESVLEAQVADTNKGHCEGVPIFSPKDHAPPWLESEWMRHGMVLVAYGNGVATRAGILCERTQILAPAGVWSDGSLEQNASIKADVIIVLAGRALAHQISARRRGDRRLDKYFELTLEQIFNTDDVPARSAARVVVHARDAAHNDQVAYAGCRVEEDSLQRFGCGGRVLVE